MNEVLRKMDKSKRKDIINSAMEEFSKYGFERASTNRIVKKAGVSKGLLFHYFENKEMLYKYLKAFAMDETISHVASVISDQKEDIFDRLLKVTLVKLELQITYPYIYSFLLSVYESKSYDEMKKLSNEQSGNLINRVYTENIDYHLFRDDIEVDKAINIIRWTFEKFSEEIMGKMKSNHEEYSWMLEEIKVYVAMLRRGFYKEGCHD